MHPHRGVGLRSLVECCREFIGSAIAFPLAGRQFECSQTAAQAQSHHTSNVAIGRVVLTVGLSSTAAISLEVGGVLSPTSSPPRVLGVSLCGASWVLRYRGVSISASSPPGSEDEGGGASSSIVASGEPGFGRARRFARLRGTFFPESFAGEGAGDSS